MAMKIDPVTLDIVKDSLIAVSNEVFYAFARTSVSPIIYETLDYASGIADADWQPAHPGQRRLRLHRADRSDDPGDRPEIRQGADEAGRRLPHQRPLHGRRHPPVRHRHGHARLLRRRDRRPSWATRPTGRTSAAWPPAPLRPTPPRSSRRACAFRASSWSTAGALRPARRHDQIERPLPRRLGGRHVGARSPRCAPATAASASSAPNTASRWSGAR